MVTRDYDHFPDLDPWEIFECKLYDVEVLWDMTSFDF